MTVIVLASHKGGAGKTTISILLAEELARMGYDIGVIEADKEQHVLKYLAGRNQAERTENFTLYTERNPDTMGSTIRRVESAHEVVIVDLPGYEGLEFTRAVARANLVLIPFTPSTMDNTSAGNAMNQIALEEEHLERQICHRIVFNMVKDAVRGDKAVGITRSEAALRAHMKAMGYPLMKAGLTLRLGPFRASYDFSETLAEMLEREPKPSWANALMEVRALAEEVVETLSDTMTDKGVDA